MEVDVIGVASEDGRQTVYTAEVLTHLDGTPYSGTPSSDRWSEFGGDKYQVTLEKLWEKFEDDHKYVTNVFDDADEYVFEFWSTTLPDGMLLDGLDQLKEDFEKKYDCEFRVVVNEKYAKQIGELQTRAKTETKGYSTPAYRFLQILGHMREDQER